MVDVTRNERDEVLRRIWLAQARKIAEILETTDAKDLQAATLNTARQFLADNGINNETFSKANEARVSMVAEIAAAKRLIEEGEYLPVEYEPGHDPNPLPPPSFTARLDRSE